MSTTLRYRARPPGRGGVEKKGLRKLRAEAAALGGISGRDRLWGTGPQAGDRNRGEVEGMPGK